MMTTTEATERIRAARTRREAARAAAEETLTAALRDASAEAGAVMSAFLAATGLSTRAAAEQLELSKSAIAAIARQAPAGDPPQHPVTAADVRAALADRDRAVAAAHRFRTDELNRARHECSNAAAGALAAAGLSVNAAAKLVGISRAALRDALSPARRPRRTR